MTCALCPTQGIRREHEQLAVVLCDACAREVGFPAKIFALPSRRRLRPATDAAVQEVARELSAAMRGVG